MTKTQIYTAEEIYDGVGAFGVKVHFHIHNKEKIGKALKFKEPLNPNQKFVQLDYMIELLKEIKKKTYYDDKIVSKFINDKIKELK